MRSKLIKIIEFFIKHHQNPPNTSTGTIRDSYRTKLRAIFMKKIFFNSKRLIPFRRSKNSEF